MQLSEPLCVPIAVSNILSRVVTGPAGTRPRPIMLKMLPIMLLSSAKKISLLCSKLCFQNQDYSLELIVILEYINLS